MAILGRPGPREAIEAELARAGCKLGQGAGGLRLMDCADQRSRVRALDALAWHDARYDPAIRRIAFDVARGVRRTEAGKVDTGELARALHRAVTERVAYLGEGAETFQTARETWEAGQGDCDDAARLLLALCRSVALPARLAVLSGADDAHGDLTPTHASVQIAPDGKAWAWAEPSLKGALFGEAPKAAARRLRAGRGELAMGEALRPLPGAAPVEVEALSTIRRVWPIGLGVGPTPFAVFAAAAVAGLESSWGRGWKGDAAGSHNWGAVHCPQAPPCPPGCVEVPESRPGATYQACLRVYASHEEGARHFLAVLLGHPERRAALARGFSALDVADAMRRSGYYEGACPDAGHLDKDGCHREAVARYAAAMLARSAQIARVTGEPDALALGGQAAPGIGAVLVVGGLALGAAWWLSRRA